MTKLSPRTRDKLKTVSTATLSTAHFKRGFRTQFIQNVYPLNPAAGPMVGARTGSRIAKRCGPLLIQGSARGSGARRRTIRLPAGAAL